jgi:hypothetical protein
MFLFPRDQDPNSNMFSLIIVYTMILRNHITMIYFIYNNKVYYDRFGQNLPSQLPEDSKNFSNFHYPNDIKFGINYDRLDNQKLRNENYSANTTYFLYNQAFNSDNPSFPIINQTSEDLASE